MTWEEEKEELERTHHGWFVAYQDGERVALEPDCNRLVASMDKQLGSPRRPCLFHEIGAVPNNRLSPRFSGATSLVWRDGLEKADKQEKVIEALAQLGHEQWAHWANYMLNNFDNDHIEYWHRQRITKYTDLSEEEKDSDREWAEKVYELFEESGLLT